MPVICIGPVCIPMNLLLPFLIGVLHRYGWFKWFKAEWVTFRYWGQQCKRLAAWWRGEKLPQAPENDAALQQDVRKADKAAQDVSKTNITEQSIELKDMKLSDAAEAKDEVVKAAAGAADTLQQAADGVLRQRSNATSQGSGTDASKGADISKAASNAVDEVKHTAQAAKGKTTALSGEADPWSKDWWAGMAKAE